MNDLSHFSHSSGGWEIQDQGTSLDLVSAKSILIVLTEWKGKRYFLKKIKGANPIQEGSIPMTPKNLTSLYHHPMNFAGTQTFSL